MVLSIPDICPPPAEVITTGAIDEAGLQRLAEVLALALRRGDLVTLCGDLGAGKTTFARALIRAVVGDAEAEVPSPTYSLVQNYETGRFAIAHLDLYRLSSPEEIAELGIEESLGRGIVLVEWPEKSDRLPSAPRLQIVFAETDDPDRRRLTLSGYGPLGARLQRAGRILDFLVRQAEPGAGVRFMQGDASARAYARVVGTTSSQVLMDWPSQPDGPVVRDGRPYSRIAHLAESVRPFVAVARWLDRHGFTVPRVAAADLDAGLLLLDDLGTEVFGDLVAAGRPLPELWTAAVDVLIALRRVPVNAPLPVGDGTQHVLPHYDRTALAIETELLLDWLWPAVKGAPAPADAVADFRAAWIPVIEQLAGMPRGLVLRDFHSPNLLWLPQRSGLARVGLIDFQDAVAGPVAYDLASLLLDARLDVPATLETMLIERYCDAVAAAEPGFDPVALRFAYAALGLQRNTKILGIFARLSRRDSKHSYLAHIPRIWDYVGRCLAHPELGGLAAWYARHWPVDERCAPRAPVS